MRRYRHPHSPSLSLCTGLVFYVIFIGFQLIAQVDASPSSDFPFIRTQCSDPLCPKEGDKTSTVVTNILNGHTTMDKIRPAIQTFCKDTTKRQLFTREDSGGIATHKDLPTDLDWFDAGTGAQIAFEVTYGDDVDLKEATAENNEKNCITRMGIAPTVTSDRLLTSLLNHTSCWGGRNAQPPSDSMTSVRSSAYTIIGKKADSSSKRAEDNTLMAWKIWVKPKVSTDGSTDYSGITGIGTRRGRRMSRFGRRNSFHA